MTQVAATTRRRARVLRRPVGKLRITCPKSAPASPPRRTPTVNTSGASEAVSGARNPGEPGEGHQQAEARLGPATPRVEAGADEAPSDQRPEDGPHARVGEVLAAEHEQHVPDSA